MMTKIENSWRLFKTSIAVTLKHRKLLWFPFLITLATGFIAIFFLSAMAIPMFVLRLIPAPQHWPTWKGTVVPALPPLYSLGLLVMYFASMFLATFFNVAFYNEIIAALNGKGVSFRRGLRAAYARLPAILAWSLLAGLVGWLIRRVEERLPFVGRIAAGFIGMAWSVAAVFAIPVIIQEQAIGNPFKILQQSALTLKRTWGEGLIGYLGFSAGNSVVFLCSLPPLLLAGALAWLTKSWWIIAVAGAFWLLGLLAMAYLVSVAGNVYRCALYMYAAEGVVPEPYDQELLDMAWKVKKA